MSGPEGFVKVSEFQPDLILLDIIMPGMDGFEVLQTLKDSDDTRAIPVIVITSLTDVENEEKGLMLGAVDYITKPFNKAIVLARIKTHQKIVEQMRLIERHSLYDPLTNILNRRSFDFHIEVVWGNAVRQKESLSVLMIDIDNFKNLNDTYGHPQGDIALQTVANAISIVLKRATDLLFRWGGEEFAVLLPSTNLEGAAYVGERIRESIQEAVIPSIEGTPLPNVTASIGIASIVPSVDDDIAELVRSADIALYKAKKSGKNRVCSLD